MKGFYRWFIENYINEDSPLGDLAYDMKRDANCPKVRVNFQPLVKYLEPKILDKELIEELFEAYKTFLKERSNENN